MSARTESRAPSGVPAEVAAALRVLYVVWGAIGLSILILFAVLLVLQRQGVVEIASALGPGATTLHVVAAGILFVAEAFAVGSVRGRVRDPERLALRPAHAARASAREASGTTDASPARRVLTRAFTLSVAGWALAEGLALIGFTLALALPPVPRLALTVYFTGALFLWLWSRPAPQAILAAWRRAAAAA